MSHFFEECWAVRLPVLVEMQARVDEMMSESCRFVGKCWDSSALAGAGRRTARFRSALTLADLQYLVSFVKIVRSVVLGCIAFLHGSVLGVKYLPGIYILFCLARIICFDAGDANLEHWLSHQPPPARRAHATRLPE